MYPVLVYFSDIFTIISISGLFGLVLVEKVMSDSIDDNIKFYGQTNYKNEAIILDQLYDAYPISQTNEFNGFPSQSPTFYSPSYGHITVHRTKYPRKKLHKEQALTKRRRQIPTSKYSFDNGDYIRKKHINSDSELSNRNLIPVKSDPQVNIISTENTQVSNRSNDALAVEPTVANKQLSPNQQAIVVEIISQKPIQFLPKQSLTTPKPGSYASIFSNPICKTAGVANHSNWRYLPKNCGVSRMKDRIIGGKQADPGDFPWVIKMTFGSKTVLPTVFVDVPILCSGGLISQYYVITADHCTRNEKGVFVRSVIIGKNMLEMFPCPNDVCDGLTQKHDVEKVIQYTSVTFKNKADSSQETNQHDIALLKLKTGARYNEYIQPVCLPKGDFLDHPGLYIKEGEHVTVSGFGSIEKTDHMKTSRNNLMYVHLTIQPIKTCAKYPFSEFKRIDTSLICAGDPPNKDTCAGDSGSPVVKPLSVKGPPRYYILGVVSFGLTTCADDYAVYVNVACYIKWILDSIER